MTFYTLQFLRFIAAMLVLFFHLVIVSSGYKGVDIFFLISGFVMYFTLFARKRPSPVHFIVNRATKIFFLYWVALLFLFVVDPATYNLVNTKTLLLIPGHLSLVGVSWSLSFELYFYFVIGTGAYLLAKKYQRLLFIFLLVVTTITTVINQFTPRLMNTPLNYGLGPNFWEFLLGVLAGYLSINYHQRISPKISLSIAIAALFLFLVISIKHMDPVVYVIYGPLSFLVILFFTVYEQRRAVSKKFAGLFKLAGDASYGIYLFGPIITIYIGQKDLSSKILIIISTVVFSVLFNIFVENRVLQLVRKLLYKRFPKAI